MVSKSFYFSDNKLKTDWKPYHRVLVEQLNDNFGGVRQYFVKTAIDLNILKYKSLIPGRADCCWERLCDLALCTKYDSRVRICGKETETFYFLLAKVLSSIKFSDSILSILNPKPRWQKANSSK